MLATIPLGCDLPRDAEDSLERARRGALRVGVSEHPPWVERGEREPGGREPDLVREFAAAVGARVEWRWGASDALLGALEHFELDLVIAGLRQSSPWKQKVGLSQPHAEADGAKRVIAVAPGENALLLALDRFILRRSP